MNQKAFISYPKNYVSARLTFDRSDLGGKQSFLRRREAQVIQMSPQVDSMIFNFVIPQQTCSCRSNSQAKKRGKRSKS